jgi:hypothetical protein
LTYKSFFKEADDITAQVVRNREKVVGIKDRLLNFNKRKRLQSICKYAKESFIIFNNCVGKAVSGQF